jgi:hypothetical protein
MRPPAFSAPRARLPAPCSAPLSKLSKLQIVRLHCVCVCASRQSGTAPLQECRTAPLQECRTFPCDATHVAHAALPARVLHAASHPTAHHQLPNSTPVARPILLQPINQLGRKATPQVATHTLPCLPAHAVGGAFVRPDAAGGAACVSPLCGAGGRSRARPTAPAPQPMFRGAQQTVLHTRIPPRCIAPPWAANQPHRCSAARASARRCA